MGDQSEAVLIQISSFNVAGLSPSLYFKRHLLISHADGCCWSQFPRSSTCVFTTRCQKSPSRWPSGSPSVWLRDAPSKRKVPVVLSGKWNSFTSQRKTLKAACEVMEQEGTLRSILAAEHDEGFETLLQPTSFSCLDFHQKCLPYENLFSCSTSWLNHILLWR